MEHTTQTPEVYDFRQYDRLWQRVAPDLEPYPDMAIRSETSPPTAAPTPSSPAIAPTPESPAVPVSANNSLSLRQESQLPGAERNPCCMGTQARESLDVLAGFIEEELAERRSCLSLCRRVHNASVTRLLRRIAHEKQCAARDMCSAYYLITGQSYTPAIAVDQMQRDSLAAALRSCYHQEACNGFNYARASDGTADLCLQKLFDKLSKQSYRRAEEIMCALGQVLC